MITLREVCENVGVSRRAVQGYERAGLVIPTGKNERGHLLYDESEQEKIRQIKFFQEMGFSIKEIKEFLGAPKEARKAAMEAKIETIRLGIEQKESIIQMAQELLKQL